MAIVSKPDGENVTLYDIPDDQLEQYKLSPEKAAEMFPEKEGPGEPMGSVQSANVSGGDVQAYGNHRICYAWRCNAWGQCWYVWWYC